MVYVGIDLGGTNIAVGVVSEAGSILAQTGAKTLADRPYQAVVRDMADLVKRAIAKARLTLDDIKAVGIGIPGVAFADTGVVYNCTNLGWINIPLREEMKKYIDKPILIDNDANAAALAESVAGASVGCKSSILLTLGTGVGGGVIIEGKPWAGAHGRAGEMGHMILVPDGVPCTCGKSGCVERYCSGTALIREAKQTCCNFPETSILQKAGGNIEKINAKLVIDAAKEGDAPALRVFNSFARYLAMTINNLIWAFDPEIVVLGGGLSYAGDFLLSAVRAFIPLHQMGAPLPIAPVVLARLGNEAGVIGAAMLGR